MDVLFDILTHPRALILYAIFGVLIAVGVITELRRDQKKLRLLRLFDHTITLFVIPGPIVAGWILISKFGLIIGIPASIFSVLGVLIFYHSCLRKWFGIDKIVEDLDGVKRHARNHKLFKAEGGSPGAWRDVESFLRTRERSIKEFYKNDPSLDEVFGKANNQPGKGLVVSLPLVRLSLMDAVSDSDWGDLIDLFSSSIQNRVLPIKELLDLLGDEKKVKQIFNPSSAQLVLLSANSLDRDRKAYEEMDEWWRMWANMAVDCYLGEPVIASLLHVFYRPDSDSVSRKLAACSGLSHLNYWFSEVRNDVRGHGIDDLMDTIDAIEVAPGQTVQNLDCWASSVRLLVEVMLEQEQLSAIQSLATLKTMFRLSAGANLSHVQFVSRLSDDLDSASVINPLITQYILQSTRHIVTSDQAIQNSAASSSYTGMKAGIFERFLDDTSSKNTYDKGLAFEDFCQQLLEKMGFIVTREGGSGDRGVDLIADDPSPLGGKTVIQCKHYDSGTVAQDVVARTLGMREYSNANKALIITTGRFSRDAIKYADGNSLVDLWDRKTLAEHVSRYLES